MRPHYQMAFSTCGIVLALLIVPTRFATESYWSAGFWIAVGLLHVAIMIDEVRTAMRGTLLSAPEKK